MTLVIKEKIVQSQHLMAAFQNLTNIKNLTENVERMLWISINDISNALLVILLLKLSLILPTEINSYLPSF